MLSKFTRFGVVAATLAATAVASVGLGSSSAFAAGPLGALTLTPQAGNSTTSFTLAPPSGSSCTGSGSGTPSYRWQTYMVDSGVDASTLTYASGPNAVAGHFVSPLYDTFGNPVTNQNPSASPLGLINVADPFSFSTIAGLGTVTNGTYKIGIACTQAGNLDAGKFWETPITISNATATSFNYAFGAVPAAPVLSATLSPGNGTLAGSFTAAASTPAQSGYTVTAVPTAGPTVTLPVAAPGAFTLTGLTNGTAYSVSVTATNTVGTSAASNTVTATPAPPTAPAPSPFTATSGVGQVSLAWTPATVPSGATLVNHIVTVSPSVAGSPFTVPAGTNALVVTAPVATYTFTIQATYSPSFFAGATATATADALPAQVIIQDIDVNRPVGALVLTQRCGVNGALPAVPADPANGFGALAVLAASGNQTGTAPAIGSLAGPLVTSGEFAQYPYPVDATGVPNPTYSTHCGINLGVGQLITSGPRAGQYFTATGNINQVTVVDTRDTDPGFTINGQMSAFTNGTSTFSGNYLGWQPVVTSTSGATLAGYDQTVAAGATLQPSLATGLQTVKQPLASAIAGQGLGISTLDARLKLLIPLTARNGGFTATMTFTTA